MQSRINISVEVAQLVHYAVGRSSLHPLFRGPVLHPLFQWPVQHPLFPGPSLHPLFRSLRGVRSRVMAGCAAPHRRHGGRSDPGDKALFSSCRRQVQPSVPQDDTQTRSTSSQEVRFKQKNFFSCLINFVRRIRDEKSSS